MSRRASRSLVELSLGFLSASASRVDDLVLGIRRTLFCLLRSFLDLWRCASRRHADDTDDESDDSDSEGTNATSDLGQDFGGLNGVIFGDSPEHIDLLADVVDGVFHKVEVEG